VGISALFPYLFHKQIAGGFYYCSTILSYLRTHGKNLSGLQVAKLTSLEHMHACSGQCKFFPVPGTHARTHAQRDGCVCVPHQHVQTLCMCRSVRYDLVSISLNKHAYYWFNLSRGPCIRFHGQQLQSS